MQTGQPQSKAKEIVTRLKELKLRTAAELVEQKVGETITSPTLRSLAQLKVGRLQSIVHA
jgi:hypothetical protein